MNSKSKTSLRSIAAIAAMLTVTAAMAANGTTPLGDCYNRVIAVCNEGNHPVPCAENAMDGCDEVYGAQIFVGAFGLKTALPAGGQTREHILLSH